MCRFPGHEKHESKDCKFNPKSKNYCGTHYTDSCKKIKSDETKKEVEFHDQQKEESDDESLTPFYFATDQDKTEKQFCIQKLC